MKREDWRLWIALLAAITFIALVLDARQKQRIDDRIDDNRIFAGWFETAGRH